MALGSGSKENQILNLWISLESLVPAETKPSDLSNIEHICASIIPFLNINYAEKILNNLTKDLLRWDYRLVRTLVKNVEGDKLVDKIARILILEENKEIRTALLESTRGFVLLHDRIHYLEAAFADPATVVATLSNHQQRLEWQLRRIYRARNIIVHSGNTPPYVKTLIEHAHDYLDSVLFVLVKLASSPKIINSVAQGFMYIDLRYKEYVENLSVKGQAFTGTNIEQILFGECRWRS